MTAGAQGWRNWSGGVRSHPAVQARPQDEAELAALLKGARGNVRVWGSGHSFTPLCATDGTLISLDAMQGVVATDAARQTATLRAGTKIHAIGRPLFDAGLGLLNQGDIDRQAIAGGVSTGTHGTGKTLQCFSAAVAALKLVTPGGEIIAASPDQNRDVFEAGRLSLGACGVLSEITMKVRPAYRLREETRIVPGRTLLQDFAALAAKHRHAEFFWFPYADDAALKILDETDEAAPPPKSSEAMKARGEAVSSDIRIFDRACRVARVVPPITPTLHRFFTRGMTGSTRVRWSHEIFPSPRNVRFNEMEYALPTENGLACVEEVIALVRRERIRTAFPIEYRTVASDDVWLSPFHGRASATIAVHQHHTHDTNALFPKVEAIFRRYGGRPHWGKMHTRSAAELKSLYPRYADFARVRAELDPKRVMLNAHLAAMFPDGGP